MTIVITTRKAQAEFLQGYKFISGRTIGYQPHPTEIDFFNVTIEFPDWYDTSLVGQVMMAAGVTYGLDLDYSSYDNEPARVR